MIYYNWLEGAHIAPVVQIALYGLKIKTRYCSQSSVCVAILMVVVVIIQRTCHQNCRRTLVVMMWICVQLYIALSEIGRGQSYRDIQVKPNNVYASV